jgi:hypothetical protein
VKKVRFLHLHKKNLSAFVSATTTTTVLVCFVELMLLFVMHAAVGCFVILGLQSFPCKRIQRQRHGGHVGTINKHGGDR